MKSNPSGEESDPLPLQFCVTCDSKTFEYVTAYDGLLLPLAPTKCLLPCQHCRPTSSCTCPISLPLELDGLPFSLSYPKPCMPIFQHHPYASSYHHPRFPIWRPDPTRVLFTFVAVTLFESLKFGSNRVRIPLTLDIWCPIARTSFPFTGKGKAFPFCRVASHPWRTTVKSRSRWKM